MHLVRALASAAFLVGASGACGPNAATPDEGPASFEAACLTLTPPKGYTASQSGAFMTLANPIPDFPLLTVYVAADAPSELGALVRRETATLRQRRAHEILVDAPTTIDGVAGYRFVERDPGEYNERFFAVRDGRAIVFGLSAHDQSARLAPGLARELVATVRWQPCD